jgi:hypothetical protein
VAGEEDHKKKIKEEEPEETKTGVPDKSLNDNEEEAREKDGGGPSTAVDELNEEIRAKKEAARIAHEEAEKEFKMIAQKLGLKNHSSEQDSSYSKRKSNPHDKSSTSSSSNKNKKQKTKDASAMPRFRKDKEQIKAYIKEKLHKLLKERKITKEQFKSTAQKVVEQLETVLKRKLPELRQDESFLTSDRKKKIVNLIHKFCKV